MVELRWRSLREMEEEEEGDSSSPSTVEARVDRRPAFRFFLCFLSGTPTVPFRIAGLSRRALKPPLFFFFATLALGLGFASFSLPALAMPDDVAAASPASSLPITLLLVPSGRRTTAAVLAALAFFEGTPTTPSRILRLSLRALNLRGAEAAGTAVPSTTICAHRRRPPTVK